MEHEEIAASRTAHVRSRQQWLRTIRGIKLADLVPEAVRAVYGHLWRMEHEALLAAEAELARPWWYRVLSAIRGR